MERVLVFFSHHLVDIIGLINFSILTWESGSDMSLGPGFATSFLRDVRLIKSFMPGA